jgi:phage-related protein
MEKEWKVILYRNEEGISPVEDFINSLSEKDYEKITKHIEYLKNIGIELRRPQGDYLEDGIYELRVRLQKYKQTRTLYFFCFEDYIILTHTFAKITDKIPEIEIKKSIKYKENFLQKYNSKENLEEDYNASKFHKI